MVRNIKYDHNKVITGSQDATKQVSRDEWNDGHNELGMFGWGVVTTLTVATGAIIPVNSMHKIDGEGAAADDLDNITNTETAEFDELWLLGGAQTITMRDNSASSGNIFTLTGTSVTLSTTRPVKLVRIGTNWHEVITNVIIPDTPWTVDHDADGFDLNDLSNIVFRTSTGAPAATTQAIYADADGIIMNVPTGDDFTISVNDVDEYILSATELDVLANNIVNISNLELDNTGSTRLIEIVRGEALADDTIIGEVRFRSFDGLSANQNYANIVATMESDVDASEDGSLKIKVTEAGAHDVDYLTFNDASNGLITALKTINVSTGTVQEAGVDISPIGTHQIWVDAKACFPATTNPCSAHTQVELATNDVDLFSLDFAGATTNEIAKYDWVPPENWNNGTITCKPYWTAVAGAGTVEFEFSAVAISNDDAMDAAFGTAQASLDTFIAADDLHVGPATSAITIGGTPVAADWVQIRIVRDQVNDTKAEDARFLGFILEYTVDESTSSG